VIAVSGAAVVDNRDPQRWAKTMAALGRVVVVTAAVATVAALVLVERLSVTYRDGLTVTEASAALVTDSVDPIRTLADDLAELAATMVEGLELADSLVANAEATLADLGTASVTNLSDAATAAADIADRLAATFETIERFIPGDKDSIAEELRAFADGLEPVAEQLRTIGDQLTIAATDLGNSRATLAQLAEQIDVIATDIGGLGPTFDALDAAAEDLQARADAASDRIDFDLWLGRILIVAVGAVFAAVGIIADRFGRAWVAGSPNSAHVDI
jgi:hypothetical protein